MNLTNVTMGNGLISIPSKAFYNCTNLTSVTIGTSVSNIGDGAFGTCANLKAAYFKGDAPLVGTSVFLGDNDAIVYYLPGTTGWGATFGGSPTALWQPEVQTSGDSFGVRTNEFGFNITWASGMVIVVEACTNLTIPVWQPIETNTLTADLIYFSDPQWMNYPRRFYRLRSP